jgi:hypothetical protein
MGARQRRLGHPAIPRLRTRRQNEGALFGPSFIYNASDGETQGWYIGTGPRTVTARGSPCLSI